MSKLTQDELDEMIAEEELYYEVSVKRKSRKEKKARELQEKRLRKLKDME